MKQFMLPSLCALLFLTACNTFEGLGKDVESAGQAISGGASNTKESMREQQPQQQPPQQHYYK